MSPPMLGGRRWHQGGEQGDGGEGMEVVGSRLSQCLPVGLSQSPHPSPAGVHPVAPQPLAAHPPRPLPGCPRSALSLDVRPRPLATVLCRPVTVPVSLRPGSTSPVSPGRIRPWWQAAAPVRNPQSSEQGWSKP